MILFQRRIERSSLFLTTPRIKKMSYKAVENYSYALEFFPDGYENKKYV